MGHKARLDSLAGATVAEVELPDGATPPYAIARVKDQAVHKNAAGTLELFEGYLEKGGYDPVTASAAALADLSNSFDLGQLDTRVFVRSGEEPGFPFAPNARVIYREVTLRVVAS